MPTVRLGLRIPQAGPGRRGPRCLVHVTQLGDPPAPAPARAAGPLPVSLSPPLYTRGHRGQGTWPRSHRARGAQGWNVTPAAWLVPTQRPLLQVPRPQGGHALGTMGSAQNGRSLHP